MGQEVLRRYDRYFLLDRVAQGGMAEIFRARSSSIDGAGRILVIKRILAGYGRNPDFRRMFRSEIKVMMGFSHPNIVQLFDFGEVSGQPYIAMEYVEGRNLRQVLNRYTEVNKKIPLNIAVFIAEQAAAGLHYAHSFKDRISGERLNIVHRDVSPQNILISYDGTVKVIDFGIAKAKSNHESTKVGVIKGKPSYLSPEQIMGETLDGRSDLFSLGIVLWEVLSGRKLFSAAKGENEFAVLKQIESCDQYVKPPSSVNPEVPKELDFIVLKALTKDRALRYQTLDEFQRALHRFASSHFPDFNPSDLSFELKMLFREQIAKERKVLQELHAKVEHLIEEGIGSSPAIEVKHSGSGEIVLDAQNQQVGAPPPSPEEEESRGKTSFASRFDAEVIKNLKVEIETDVGAAARAKNQKSLETEHKPDATFGAASNPSSPSVDNRSNRMSYSELRAKKRMKPNEGPRKKSSGMGIALVVLGFMGMVLFIAINHNNWKMETEPNLATFQERKLVTVRLKINPSLTGVQIELNGKPISADRPIFKVVPGELQTLIVTRRNYKKVDREFTLDPGQYKHIAESDMEVVLEPLEYGYLTIHSVPSAEAKITSITGQNRTLANVEGEELWTWKTPIENEKFPVGKYEVVLENKVLGMTHRETIEVKRGLTVKLDAHLTPDR